MIKIQTSDLFKILQNLALLAEKEGKNQCCGSMTFWCGSGSGSGSADPRLWLMDPDPDADPGPAIISSLTFKMLKKLIFFKVFCLLLFEGTFTSVFKDKKSKRSHKAIGIKVFLTIFAW